MLDNPVGATDPDTLASAIKAASTYSALYRVVQPVNLQAQQLLANANGADRLLTAAQLAAIRKAVAGLTAARNQLKLAYDNAPGGPPSTAIVNAVNGALMNLFAAAGSRYLPLSDPIVDTVNHLADEIRKSVPQLGVAAKYVVWTALGVAGIYVLSQLATITRTFQRA